MSQRLTGLATPATFSRRAAGAALALAAILMLGCEASPRGIAPPGIALVGLTSLPGGVDRQRFRLRFTLDNMNTEPLDLAETEFVVRLSTEGRLQGSIGELELPALEQRTVEVVVESDILASVSRLRVLGSGEAIPYELLGNFTLDRHFQNTLPFHASGDVPLSTEAAGP